jgi:hypothetical protein
MLGNITGDYPIQPAQFSIIQFKLDCVIVINQSAGDSSCLSALYFKLSQMASWSITDGISIASQALELTITSPFSSQTYTLVASRTCRSARPSTSTSS